MDILSLAVAYIIIIIPTRPQPEKPSNQHTAKKTIPSHSSSSWSNHKNNASIAASAPSNCFNKYRGIITCSKEDYEAAKFIYNGLDRVDNKLPHTPENCVPCCAKCNTAKNDRSQKDFLDWAERAYQFLLSRKVARYEKA